MVSPPLDTSADETYRFYIANYKSVVLAAYKYLDLLRRSTFEDYHHKEVVDLSNLRFRFAEKKRPDDYATGITEHMAWPTPREKLLTGPRLTWDWEDEADKQQGEARIRQYLESFRINESRVVLMAKQADHEKVHPGLHWEKEPWYGTQYAVQRFDDDMCRQVNEHVPSCFHVRSFVSGKWNQRYS